MQRLGMLWRFLLYYWNSETIYKIHSPFVFQFCKQVIEDKRWFYAFSMIEPVRQAMLQNFNEIQVTDLGAGSSKGKPKMIADIAKTALSPFDQCKYLFKIVNLYQPDTILEMGTSLGISAMYQAMPKQKAQMITLEGCGNIARQASHNFKKLNLENIDLKIGDFQQTMPDALETLQTLDYAFIDGNHQKEATIQYFQKCLKYASDRSILIFDDIYWSKGMSEAWEEIKQHPSVTLSIDLYFMGLIFFRKTQKHKQHFKIVPSRWKPWQMGFFK